MNKSVRKKILVSVNGNEGYLSHIEINAENVSQAVIVFLDGTIDTVPYKKAKF